MTIIVPFTTDQCGVRCYEHLSSERVVSFRLWGHRCQMLAQSVLWSGSRMEHEAHWGRYSAGSYRLYTPRFEPQFRIGRLICTMADYNNFLACFGGPVEQAEPYWNLALHYGDRTVRLVHAMLTSVSMVVTAEGFTIAEDVCGRYLDAVRGPDIRGEELMDRAGIDVDRLLRAGAAITP